MIEDAEYCYADEAIGGGRELEIGEKRLLSAEQLADFCDAVFRVVGLPNTQTLRIVLAVCYGARTSEYYRDHVVEARQLDFTDTFAYRFSNRFRLISNVTAVPKAHVFAYLGAVCFDDATGELMAETEEGIKNGFKAEDLSHEMRHITKILDQMERDRGSQALMDPLYQELDARVDEIRIQRGVLEGPTMARRAGEALYFVGQWGVEFDLDRFIRTNTQPLPAQHTTDFNSKCVCFSVGGVDSCSLDLPRKRGLKC